MVEIQVGVADATTVHGLMRRLVPLFGRPSVSFDAARREVRVRSEWESRSVLRVIESVESWLAAGGPESATLSIGTHSYTMVGPTR
jgi:hypothetical protein